MVGAFIGDLAAWTYINDHKATYSQLVSDVAKKSVYADVMLFSVNTLLDNPKISRNDFIRKQWATFGKVNAKKSAVYDILHSIVIGWLYDYDEISQTINKFCLYEDKETRYASYFISHIICKLRTGSTKNEATQEDFCGTFLSFIKNDFWINSSGILGYLVRSWISFYDAFDFGSAIFNAVDQPGDIHLNFILTGALGDAMYGCNNHYVKKKYGKVRRLKRLPFLNDDIYEVNNSNRVFFPKNNAMTNVERHQWFEEECPFADKIIDNELRRKILLAFYTGWDDRYGFYLDDGWVYVYRSHILLARFILAECPDGTYRIQKYQKSDESKLFDLGNIALENALYSVEHRWDLVSKR